MPPRASPTRISRSPRRSRTWCTGNLRLRAARWKAPLPTTCASPISSTTSRRSKARRSNRLDTREGGAYSRACAGRGTCLMVRPHGGVLEGGQGRRAERASARGQVARPRTGVMSKLKIKGVEIIETFAEAFPMVGTRIILTAPTQKWALIAAQTMTGFATSVIACGAEDGIERLVPAEETLDGRPGVAVLLFTMDVNKLQTQLRNRVGQCVLTSPGSACFAGLKGEKSLKLGSSLRFFGDGWQVSKKVGGQRFWRIPVMDGEFVCEEKTGLTKKAVGGGNLLVLGKSHAGVLAACERAVRAMDEVPEVITPFPGGIVRSGSKVGSKYKGQIASTNDAYCPTLKAAVKTELPLYVEAVMEIVIDGLSAPAIAAAMRAGIHANTAGGAKEGVTHITAGNYGGNLGPHHFHLKEIIA